jgi:hypothetical protein
MIFMKILLLMAILVFVACGSDNGEEPQVSATPPVYEPSEVGENGDTPVQAYTPDYYIVVNGVGLGYEFYTPEGAAAPTHVPIMPVLNALGIDFTHNHVSPMVFSLSGDFGSIDITDRSYTVLFNGEELDMSDEAMMLGRNFYAPIVFFSEILELSTVEFSGGYVTISQ